MAKFIKIKQSNDSGPSCISADLVKSSFLAEVDTLLSFAQPVGFSGLGLPVGVEFSEWLSSVSVKALLGSRVC